MKILIVHDSKIPVTLYGGTERVIWDLGVALTSMGHSVEYLVKEGSMCPFAKVSIIDFDHPWDEQIGEDIDVVHFHFNQTQQIKKPFICTIHGNAIAGTRFSENSVFVSSNHALRNNSDSYVLNGLNWDNYTPPDFRTKESYVHFLANASWRLKNVRGAIKLARKADVPIKVLGGKRFNIRMGLRLTLDLHATFYGSVGGEEKNRLLNNSSGYLFPVLWDEPFGLSIIESMYYGNPVFGTTYGSLPELVPHEVGILSNKQSELVEGIKNRAAFEPKKVHEVALEYNHQKMAQEYLKKYELVLNNHPLNMNEPITQESRLSYNIL